MKCPYCGADVLGKICDYCRSEMPQEKANINIKLENVQVDQFTENSLFQYE